MATAVGGGPDLLKVCNPTGYDALKQLADRWGLQTILAAVQLLDESLVRMRFSVQSQALFEVALIQISQLQDLATIAKIIEAVQHGGPLPTPPKPAGGGPTTRAASAPAASAPAAPEKKNDEGLDLSSLRAARTASSASASAASSGSNTTAQRPAVDAPVAVPIAASQPAAMAAPVPAPTIQIHAAPVLSDILGSTMGNTAHAGEHATTGNASTTQSTNQSASSPEALQAFEVWRQAAATTEGMLADFAGRAQAVEVRSPDQWTIVFPPGGVKTQEYCEAPARREELQAALNRTAGRPIQFGFRVQPGPAVRVTSEVPISPTVARSQRLRQLAEHPLVSKLCELLQGEVVRVDPPAVGQVSSPHTNTNASAASAPRSEMADAT
jgi:DNA polymerase-3 subunit gamma/tau